MTTDDATESVIILVRSLQEIERTVDTLLNRIERGEPQAVAMWLRAIRSEARAALRVIGKETPQ